MQLPTLADISQMGEIGELMSEFFNLDPDIQSLATMQGTMGEIVERMKEETHANG